MEPSGSAAPPERKRKRSISDQAHRRRLNSTGNTGGVIDKAEDGTGKTSTRPPLDEEVDEFFAILRRVHAALKSLGKNDRRRTASEIGSPLTPPAIDGGAVAKPVIFDLNVAPAETNGD